MATYFHGNPEIQNDGLQTLILMNPGYVNYSDTQHQSNANSFVYANSLNLPHAPPSHTPHQYITGVPLHAPQTAVPSQDLHNQGYIPRAVEYNLWNSFEPGTAARELTRAQSNEGLSLTLSSRQPQPTSEYGSYRGERDLRSQAPETEALRISGGSTSSPVSGFSNGVSGLQQSVLLSSKYLTAAQQLLDEVVNVGNYVVKADSSKKRADGFMSESSAVSPRDGLTGGGFGSGKAGCGAELSSVERQEIQMKKAKLLGMLNEVEQRYRQYRQQMQIVMSTFEQVAGIGSAKSYTALALQTISKQFRCLKDAISGQIRAVNKCLGEEDSPSGSGGSRLKYVDNQLRQQRALQQLGMIQPNAWRPQRGLPERSVSVLRAWLFEHFLHPYPKDSDKLLLAKQTGLTRSQVSNWFINARVRLWKPMVEEMYMEEVKEQEHNLSDQDKPIKTIDHNIHETSSSKHQEKTPSVDNNQSISTFMSTQHSNPDHSAPPLMPISTASTYSSFSPKKPRNAGESFILPTMDIDVKSVNGNNDDHRHQQQQQQFVPGSYMGGYSSYPSMGGGEMGRFDGDQFSSSSRFMGNAVSLTLGLPHRDGFHAIEMGRTGVDIGVDASNYNATMSTNNVFEDLGLSNGKRYVAQQLHDFVA